MTSGSICPNTPCRIRLFPAYTNAVMTTAQIVMNQTSWVADSHAASFFLCPRYCPATTAPPVASAAKILMSSTMTWSTSETPDTAASPTLAIIIESAIPTSTARSCSTTSGIINATSDRLSNR